LQRFSCVRVKMKIVGVTYGNAKRLILKGDSALLVNRKPFFIPDETQEAVAIPCIALRVSRLGKTISPRFASRYYDAYAPALDIQAADLRARAIKEGVAWTEAVSLDGSLPLGSWKEGNVENCLKMTIVQSPSSLRDNSPIVEELERHYGVTEEQIEAGICLVSKYMTIRQGDVIYLQLTGEEIELQQNDCLKMRVENISEVVEKEATENEVKEDGLFCRIK